MNVVKYSIVGTIMAIVALWGMGGLTTIEPGEVGLVVHQFGDNKGMQDITLDTGTHWIEPFSNDVYVVDTRLKQYKLLDIPSNTKDGQPILVDVVFEIGLLDSNVPNLIENIGTDWYNQVVYPAARSSIRNNTSEKMSDEVYTGAGRASIQEQLTNELGNRLEPNGIRITANLSDIEFTNSDFVATLERKAKAAQEETIQARLADAAVAEALKVQAVAEGQKFKSIQEAEAMKEALRLKGEGFMLQKESEALGILAVGQAEADVIKMKANALVGSGGELYRDIEVLGGLGKTVEFYGVPTGAEGTSTYIIDEALRGKIAIGD
jgi:regulator of protease activity HflC (stomatin/prohibitin superfamily)